MVGLSYIACIIGVILGCVYSPTSADTPCRMLTSQQIAIHGPLQRLADHPASTTQQRSDGSRASSLALCDLSDYGSGVLNPLGRGCRAQRPLVRSFICHVHSCHGQYVRDHAQRQLYGRQLPGAEWGRNVQHHLGAEHDVICYRLWVRHSPVWAWTAWYNKC